MEALLLEVLADNAVTIPEIGTLRARHPPQVFLTSNDARELSDALRRRCLHLSVTYPEPARELAIVRAQVPDIDGALAASLVAAVQKIRTFDVQKPPSIAELIDWARALAALGRRIVDEATLQETLGALLKHRDDAALVDQRRAEVVRAAGRP
jgi:MoxR-like ATPase